MKGVPHPGLEALQSLTLLALVLLTGSRWTLFGLGAQDGTRGQPGAVRFLAGGAPS